MTANPILAERLTDFVCAWRQADPGEALLHEAKRLLLNQLKASAEASQQPAGIRLLAQAARTAGSEGAGAHLWWSGLLLTPEQAALFNGQLLSLLDFGDTHLPTLGHFTGAILPGLLAQAEIGRRSGDRLLTALVVGLEVAINCSMVPQDASVPLKLGAAAARCTLQRLDRAATAAALGPLVAAASPDAPNGLGQRWHVKDIALHCRPLPTLALAPVDAVLALRAQTGQRTLARLRLSLSPRAWSLVQGNESLRDAMAAAWLLGQFTTEEALPACREHPATQALREQIELRPDERIAGIESCVLSAEFADGSRERCQIDAFLGAPAQPLSDSQLSELFRSAADDLVLPRRSGEILQALWGLDRAEDISPLLALLRRPV
jgi:2-methylcitrate dehydratase PrpD